MLPGNGGMPFGALQTLFVPRPGDWALRPGLTGDAAAGAWGLKMGPG